MKPLERRLRRLHDAWRRYGGLAVALLSVGAATSLLTWRDVAEPSRSAANSRGEDVVLWAFLALAGGAGALLSLLEARAPSRLQAVRTRLARIPVPGVVALLGFAWVGAGILVLQGADPAWLASGIDWHDSLLAAYGLAWEDPAFYAASRFPLSPALAAAVHAATGQPLDVSLQLVTRALMLTLPIPLWIVGRRLYGRAAAIVGSGMLLLLPTFHQHVDATTCYPLYISATAWVAAGLALAGEARLIGFFLYGVALAAALAAEVKALFLGLATLPVAALLVLLVPAPPVGFIRGLGTRGLRVALVVAPLIVSYRWMGGLPVDPQSLETLSVNTLHADTAAHGDQGVEGGYVWGRWSGWDQVPRTVSTFYAVAADTPEPTRARRLENTRQLLEADYPGNTPRLLWLAAIALVLAPLVPGGSSTPRHRAGITLTLLAIASTTIPSLTTDYQDRYVAHAVIFLPLLVAGGGDLALRWILGGGRAGARAGVLVAGALMAGGWSGFPLAVERVHARATAVTRGGAAERALQAWADRTMKPGDALLDTTWLMDSLLVAGQHTVLREEPAYPPPGAAVAGSGFRVTRPGRPVNGTIYALVPQTDYAPPGRHQWGPRAIAGDPAWSVLTRIVPAMATIYRYDGGGLPPGWTLNAAHTGP